MRDPKAPLAVCVGLVAISLATDQPVVVAAALGASVLLYLAAPGRHGLMLRVALGSALLLAVLNPFLAIAGDRVLVAGPNLGLLDLEITVEEILWGVVSGMRLATAIIATSAFLALVDPDRLQALVGRIAPRSALTVALAARLVPALRRDAAQLHEALLVRGAAPADGRVARARQATTLLEPLVATSLDRGVGIAEAMAARGYGGAPFTALPEDPPERGILVLGLGLIALALLLVAGLLPYAVYPQAAPIAEPAALAAAVAILGVGAVAARALGGPR